MSPPNNIEPTLSDLLDARERADAAIRLALPQLAERIGLGAVPSDRDEVAPIVSPELADLIVEHLDAARHSIRRAMRLADPDHGGDRAAHIAIAEQLEQISSLTATLIGRWGV